MLGYSEKSTGNVEFFHRSGGRTAAAGFGKGGWQHLKTELSAEELQEALKNAKLL